MKKNVFLISAIVCCIGFSCINVIKSGIKDLRILLTMSSETLANAEAIDGQEGEGYPEIQPEKKKYIRYWDICTYKTEVEITVQFWPSPGITYHPGSRVQKLGAVKTEKKDNMYVNRTMLCMEIMKSLKMNPDYPKII